MRRRLVQTVRDVRGKKRWDLGGSWDKGDGTWARWHSEMTIGISELRGCASGKSGKPTTGEQNMRSV